MEGFIKVITSEKFYLPFVHVLVGLFLYLVVNSVINKLTAKHKSTRGRDKRKDTIIDLSKNIFKYIIVILIILQILKLYGVDTTSIIASIGVFAAVIGLAFQDILKDYKDVDDKANSVFDNPSESVVFKDKAAVRKAFRSKIEQDIAGVSDVK